MKGALIISSGCQHPHSLQVNPTLSIYLVIYVVVKMILNGTMPAHTGYKEAGDGKEEEGDGVPGLLSFLVRVFLWLMCPRHFGQL